MQKCIRTQDIEEVGKTTRHGTFFQMNGNFSFGDYFKEEAIRLAWALSTNSVEDGGFGLDGEKIWATVYLDDEEAIDIWHNTIGLPMERIVRRGKADNFWSMGIPGPCGPCSELYYDRGSDYGSPRAARRSTRTATWSSGTSSSCRTSGARAPPRTTTRSSASCRPRTSTPAWAWSAWPPCCRASTTCTRSTRCARCWTGRPSLTNKQYGLHSGHAANESHPDDVLLRVITDHTRTALMLIGDGVTPSNEGRGYVLRRILRRAVRSMRLLGYEDRAMPELLPVARDCMSASYPDLATDFDRISRYAYAEEEAFRSTLRAGTTIFDTRGRDS